MLEHGAGEVVAIEMKAAETVRGEEFRGIRHIARPLRDQLIAGSSITRESTYTPFKGPIARPPIRTLWTR